MGRHARPVGGDRRDIARHFLAEWPTHAHRRSGSLISAKSTPGARLWPPPRCAAVRKAGGRRTVALSDTSLECARVRREPRDQRPHGIEMGGGRSLRPRQTSSGDPTWPPRRGPASARSARVEPRRGRTEARRLPLDQAGEADRRHLGLCRPRGYLHDLATGRKTPTQAVARRIDEVLGLRGELAALVSVNDFDAGELARRVAASDVSDETLERLEAAVDDLVADHMRSCGRCICHRIRPPDQLRRWEIAQRKTAEQRIHSRFGAD
jgi:hypothetical protein